MIHDWFSSLESVEEDLSKELEEGDRFTIIMHHGQAHWGLLKAGGGVEAFGLLVTPDVQEPHRTFAAVANRMDLRTAEQGGFRPPTRRSEGIDERWDQLFSVMNLDPDEAQIAREIVAAAPTPEPEEELPAELWARLARRLGR